MRFGSIFTTLLACFSLSQSLSADNQTPTVSPVYPADELPFDVVIRQADFSLPKGIQSFAYGNYKGKWIFLTGRINGLHGFDNNNNNFPPNKQNRTVYVVDPEQKITFSRSLTSPGSGLTQKQIDELSVTSAQSTQHDDTLYISGGYGINTATGKFDTKDTLTAIDLEGLVHWVVDPSPGETLAQHIRQVSDPIFQVAGGYMTRVNKDLWLLVFGQNYKGAYTPGKNGVYTEQIRRFKVSDHEDYLKVSVKSPKPEERDPNYRRRDLNVIPIVYEVLGLPVRGFLALSGVFTPSGGAWTVPVLISYDGKPTMADPEDPNTFKQAMNNYNSACVGLFSDEYKGMFVVLFGGISYGYFENGKLKTDDELPFINQITAIRLDRNGHFKQFKLKGSFPKILSTATNPGNRLRFGAASQFILANNLPIFSNEVIKFDKLEKCQQLIGYIVGGIQSTLPNTTSPSDSAASPYIFEVFLKPKRE